MSENPVTCRHCHDPIEMELGADLEPEWVHRSADLGPDLPDYRFCYGNELGTDVAQPSVPSLRALLSSYADDEDVPADVRLTLAAAVEFLALQTQEAANV